MQEREISLRVGYGALRATLAIPSDARGLVIFAHGSGSSRRSPRNRFVAQELNQSGLATLLLDLLTEDEESIDERTGEFRFDVHMLAQRTAGALDWARNDAALSPLPAGYFGASTGTAAALIAAAGRDDVAAIVSRSGRPDLAGDTLSAVGAPTLLIVGERDTFVLELNQRAAKQLHKREIAIVPGATHLFEERGALEAVATLARQWFLRYLKHKDA